VEVFDISDMNAVQAKFDIQKLKWMNGEYIMKKRTEELLPFIKNQLVGAGFDVSETPDEYVLKVLDLYKIRLKTLEEFVELADCFFTDDFAVDEEGKKKYLGSEENKANIKVFTERLEKLEDFLHENIENICRDLAEEKSLKAANIIHPARMAISGKTRGAGLFEMMELLGKEKVLERMKGIGR